MRIRWTAAVVVALLAMPGVAQASGGPDAHRNASKLCKQVRGEMGQEAFRTTYGTSHNGRNAHGKCVSKHRRAVKRLVAEAVAQCKAELGAAKSLRHGRGDKGEPNDVDRAAFRACVKEKLAALLAEFKAKVEAAVTACKTEREADPAAFAEKYGKGERKRHAFRRCVYQYVRESSSAL